LNVFSEFCRVLNTFKVFVEHVQLLLAAAAGELVERKINLCPGV
jgi:hypothetical protein